MKEDPIIALICRRVRVVSRPVPAGVVGPCWEWLGSADEKGYGRVTISGVVFKVHRLAYAHLREPFPLELVIDHLCRNHLCCNPTHLEPVTSRVNTLRGESPAAKRARQTKCIAGHELAGENVYTHPKRGTRECRTCKRERRAA